MSEKDPNRHPSIPAPPPAPGSAKDLAEKAEQSAFLKQAEAKRLTQIEDVHGKEALEDMAFISRVIYQSMQEHALRTNDKAELQTYLKAWDDFSRQLSARENSSNLDASAVKIAIEGSAALMAPEGLRQYYQPAKKMADQLEARYK